MLGWSDSFVGKKRSKVSKVDPLCNFWLIWKERKRIAFENGIFSVQRLKNSFVLDHRFFRCRIFYLYSTFWTRWFLGEGG